MNYCRHEGIRHFTLLNIGALKVSPLLSVPVIAKRFIVEGTGNFTSRCEAYVFQGRSPLRWSEIRIWAD
jgi:hypothetical protein